MLALIPKKSITNAIAISRKSRILFMLLDFELSKRYGIMFWVIKSLHSIKKASQFLERLFCAEENP